MDYVDERTEAEKLQARSTGTEIGPDEVNHKWGKL
jgi:hypothetical protein